MDTRPDRFALPAFGSRSLQHRASRPRTTRGAARVIRRYPALLRCGCLDRRLVLFVSRPLRPFRMGRAVMSGSELRALPFRRHCHVHGPSLAFRVPERRPEPQVFRAAGPVAIPAHPSLSEVSGGHRGERTAVRGHRGSWGNPRCLPLLGRSREGAGAEPNAPGLLPCRHSRPRRLGPRHRRRARRAVGRHQATDAARLAARELLHPDTTT